MKSMKRVKRTRRLLGAVVATFLLPALASAAPTRVQYDVDASALKAAIAGTPLTFSYYSDSACATPAFDTEVIDIEDVDSIEVLKRFTPKNATKPPKTARIYVTHTGGGPGRWRTYMTVSGTGITPVGPACQAQTSDLPSAVATTTPAGVISIGGPYISLASLPLTVPTDGTLVLMFETEIQALDSGQVISCAVSQDMAFVTNFDMDTGDYDSPIPNYDLLQSHHEVIPVTAGPHTYDVSCTVPSGASVNTIRSKMTAVFAAASM
jgi:hypothetical protein